MAINADNITENLLDAINVIVEEKLKKLEFDKTYKAIVISTDKRNKGRYGCETNGLKYEAIGTPNEQLIGDIVYVNVPQNNWDKQKNIIGKSIMDKNSINLYSPFSYFYCPDNTPVWTHEFNNFSVMANGGKIDEIPVIEEFNDQREYKSGDKSYYWLDDPLENEYPRIGFQQYQYLNEQWDWVNYNEFDLPMAYDRNKTTYVEGDMVSVSIEGESSQLIVDIYHNGDWENVYGGLRSEYPYWVEAYQPNRIYSMGKIVHNNDITNLKFFRCIKNTNNQINTLNNRDYWVEINFFVTKEYNPLGYYYIGETCFKDVELQNSEEGVINYNRQFYKATRIIRAFDRDPIDYPNLWDQFTYEQPKCNLSYFEEDEILLNYKKYAQTRPYDAIGLKIIFDTSQLGQNFKKITQGTYGIKINFLNDKGNKVGIYDFNSSQILGNIYNTSNVIREQTFLIDKEIFESSSKIQFELYEKDDFFYSSEGQQYYISYKEDEKIKNIKITNIELFFGFDLKNFEEYELKLDTNDIKSYYKNWSNAQNTKTFFHSFLFRDENGKIQENKELVSSLWSCVGTNDNNWIQSKTYPNNQQEFLTQFITQDQASNNADIIRFKIQLEWQNNLINSNIVTLYKYDDGQG